MSDYAAEYGPDGLACRLVWLGPRKQEPPKLFEPKRCKLCGEILWIGRWGLVCPRGHGKVIQAGYDGQSKHCPELKIEHDKTVAQRGALLRGMMIR
jgi:hypothetical protein